MKNIIVLMILILSVIILSNQNNYCTYAKTSLEVDNAYVIYDEQFNVICEKDIVSVGDGYMAPDRKYYEIVYVDDELCYGIAKYVKTINLPSVDISYVPKPIKVDKKVICLYMSHNDESYVPTDGVDSVYGNGGIKDVAVAFQKCLNKRLVNTYLDDTLHIPHDSGAYSRSRVTAEKLHDKYAPDAIFDIHRDATRRSFYVAEVDGKERGRVRIVLGKSNPNLALNEEFALYLVAVANEMYPWLITDIYYGGGHYNQGLDGKALLFEMGTYLIEKELVIDSMEELADVVTTALYNTTVNDTTGDLTINGVEDAENVVVNELIDSKQEEGKVSVLAICIAIVIMASISIYAVVVFSYNVKKIVESNKRNLNIK